jgi:hypothetical protein
MKSLYKIKFEGAEGKCIQYVGADSITEALEIFYIHYVKDALILSVKLVDSDLFLNEN